MHPEDILKLIIKRVKERTDGFKDPNEHRGLQLKDVVKPYPNDQPLPKRRKELRFLDELFIETMEYALENSEPTSMTVKLRGSRNYHEWRVNWEDHVRNLNIYDGYFLRQYHEKFEDASGEPISYERFRASRPKKLQEVCFLADKFLIREIKSTVDKKLINQVRASTYHGILERVRMIETLNPHRVKAGEAYSYLKRINNIGTFESRQEHHSIYEPDWVVRVIGDSVDVTKYDLEAVAQVFERVEKDKLREAYEEAADKTRPISTIQMEFERRVREICYLKLGAPMIPDDFSDYD